jgi:uncharacterized membrane protein
METLFAWIVLVVPTVAIGGLYLLLPRISRRGLLFGVYVGEDVSGNEAARRIIRSWYRRMGAWLAASLVSGGLAAFALRTPEVSPIATLLMTAGFLIEYLRAYRQARGLAREGAPPAAAAVLAAGEPKPLLLPYLALALGIACGLFAIVYTWSRYDALPERVPTHFGLTGQPDAWGPRSLALVMLLPLLTLVLGAGVGGTAVLISQAKRAVRHPDSGVSFDAQQRFRRVMSRFLAILSLLVTGMMTSLSVSVIRAGLGKSPGIPSLDLFFLAAIVLFPLGGTLFIALRYGQGGARLERSVADRPLTDGLADNRRWVLGMFYVNREDPSFMVENRFGLGYTLNFGNWKAVALFLAFIGLVLGITFVALLNS